MLLCFRASNPHKIPSAASTRKGAPIVQFHIHHHLHKNKHYSLHSSPSHDRQKQITPRAAPNTPGATPVVRSILPPTPHIPYTPPTLLPLEAIGDAEPLKDLGPRHRDPLDPLAVRARVRLQRLPLRVGRLVLLPLRGVV